MTDQTARFALPLLAAGQAQKEVLHNEALFRLDGLCSPAVEEPPQADPPESPAAGGCWIVAAGGTGAWAGEDGRLALFTAGGWRFLDAPDGMLVWRRDLATWTVRSGGTWSDAAFPVPALQVGGRRVVGPQQPGIADPAGGTSVDTEGRSTIAAILAALRSHGLIAS